MSLLTRSELTELNEAATGPAVSLYLPTHRAGPAIRQDPIRLKNLLASAEGKLLDAGESSGAADALLAPARELVDDDDFWRHQSDGLAIFLAPGFFRSFRLPVSFEERDVVGSRFHLKPLLPLVTGDERFYVLTLSRERVRLLEGDRHRLTEADPGDAIPRSLADSVGYEVRERSLQYHTGTGDAPGRGGRRAAVFHGQGAGSDDEDAEVEQFLRRLSNALGKYLDDPPPPLVLAATEPLLGTFGKVAGYPNLVEGAVHGNHDETPAQELHREAWPLVEPRFQEALHRGRERLDELLGTGRACEGTPDVVRAAHDGRVEVLFVPLGVERWGRFDPESREVSLHDVAEEGDEDLLDLAAIRALSQGGTVFAVPEEEAPGSGGPAAILRY